MSKPVKNMIIESYKQRFAGLNGAVLVDIRGVSANDNNKLRTNLAEKQIRVTVVKNSLAKKAITGTGLEPLDDLLDGPSAMVYPVDEETSVVSIARELIAVAKQVANLQFKGALMEGIVFGPEDLDALSKYPTREEAQAKAVQLLLSPGQNLVGAILGPGRKVASLVKAIEEKLEQGETITKAA